MLKKKYQDSILSSASSGADNYDYFNSLYEKTYKNPKNSDIFNLESEKERLAINTGDYDSVFGEMYRKAEAQLGISKNKYATNPLNTAETRAREEMARNRLLKPVADAPYEAKDNADKEWFKKVPYLSEFTSGALIGAPAGITNAINEKIIRYKEKELADRLKYAENALNKEGITEKEKAGILKEIEVIKSEGKESLNTNLNRRQNLQKVMDYGKEFQTTDPNASGIERLTKGVATSFGNMAFNAVFGAGSLAAMGVSSYGTALDEGRRELNLKEEDLERYALMNGAIEAGSELIGGSAVLKTIQTQGLKAFGKEAAEQIAKDMAEGSYKTYLKEIGKEYGQEAMTEVAHIINETTFKDKDGNSIAVKDFAEALKRTNEAGLAGAIMGGVGASGNLVGAIQKDKDKKGENNTILAPKTTNQPVNQEVAEAPLSPVQPVNQEFLNNKQVNQQAGENVEDFQELTNEDYINNAFGFEIIPTNPAAPFIEKVDNVYVKEDGTTVKASLVEAMAEEQGLNPDELIQFTPEQTQERQVIQEQNAIKQETENTIGAIEQSVKENGVKDTINTLTKAKKQGQIDEATFNSAVEYINNINEHELTGDNLAQPNLTQNNSTQQELVQNNAPILEAQTKIDKVVNSTGFKKVYSDAKLTAAPKLSIEQKNAVKLSKTLNKEVVFYNAQGQAPNGFYKDNTIFINADKNGNSIMQVLGHETFHSLEKDHNKIFKELVNWGVDNFTAKEIEDYLAKIPNEKQVEILSNNPKLLSEEMLADAFGNDFANKDFWAKLQDTNKTLFDKIKEVIAKIFKKAEKTETDYLTKKHIIELRAKFDSILGDLSGITTEEVKEAPMEEIKEAPMEDAETLEKLFEEDKTSIAKEIEGAKKLFQEIINVWKADQFNDTREEMKIARENILKYIAENNGIENYKIIHGDTDYKFSSKCELKATINGKDILFSGDLTLHTLNVSIRNKGASSSVPSDFNMTLMPDFDFEFMYKEMKKELAKVVQNKKETKEDTKNEFNKQGAINKANDELVKINNKISELENNIQEKVTEIKETKSRKEKTRFKYIKDRYNLSLDIQNITKDAYVNFINTISKDLSIDKYNSVLKEFGGFDDYLITEEVKEAPKKVLAPKEEVKENTLKEKEALIRDFEREFYVKALRANQKGDIKNAGKLNKQIWNNLSEDEKLLYTANYSHIDGIMSGASIGKTLDSQIELAKLYINNSFPKQTLYPRANTFISKEQADRLSDFQLKHNIEAMNKKEYEDYNEKYDALLNEIIAEGFDPLKEVKEAPKKALKTEEVKSVEAPKKETENDIRFSTREAKGQLDKILQNVDNTQLRKAITAKTGIVIKSDVDVKGLINKYAYTLDNTANLTRAKQEGKLANILMAGEKYSSAQAKAISSYLVGISRALIKTAETSNRENSNVIKTSQSKEKIDWKEKSRVLYSRSVDKYEFLKDISTEAHETALNSHKATAIAETIMTDGLYDINGNYINISVQELFETAFPQDNKEYFDFIYYMSRKDDIDRARNGQNTMVDEKGNYFTEEQNIAFVEAQEAKYPKWRANSEKIYEWQQDFLYNYAVKTGLLSEESFADILKKHKFYIPKFRVEQDPEGSNLYTANFTGASFVNKPSTVKSAKGGDQDLLDFREGILQNIENTVKTAVYNEVGQEVLKSVRRDAELKDLVSIVPESKQDGNTVSVMENGKKVYIKVKDAEIMRALKNVTLEGNQSAEKAFVKFFRTLNNAKKKLITVLSPLFMLTNTPRDAGNYFMKFKGTKRQAFEYAKRALNEMRNKGEYYELFEAVGADSHGLLRQHGAKQVQDLTGKKAVIDKDGVMLGFRDAPTSLKTMQNAMDFLEVMGYKIKKTEEGLSDFTGFTEQMWRLGAFMYELDNGGNIRTATRAAADITTDFSRSGDITKTVDAFVMFLNAGVQGIDNTYKQLFRNETDTDFIWKDKKKLTRNLQNAFTYFILPAIMQAALIGAGDDERKEEYEAITDRVKDSNWIIPNYLSSDKGSFIKIPKSREYGTLIAAPFQRIIEGRGFKGYGQTIAENMAPENPLANNIFMETGKMFLEDPKDFLGRSIIPTELKNFKAGEQTDKNTTVLATALGKITNISPKKIDYTLDQWTGFVGDLLMPILTEDYWDSMKNSSLLDKGLKVLQPVTTRLSTNTAYSNQNSTDFYAYKKELTQIIAAEQRGMSTEEKRATTTPGERVMKQIKEQSDYIADISAALDEDGLSEADKKYLRRQKNYAMKEANEILKKFLAPKKR